MLGRLFPRKKVNRLERIIRSAAEEHEVRFELLASIIYQESKGNRFALRYEDAFYKRYIANRQRSHDSSRLSSVDTEKRARAFSYGACQIMGLTAREFGFKGDFLTELIKLKTNVHLGARILSRFIELQGSERAGVKRYNGTGARAEAYADKIYDHMGRRTYLSMFKE